MSEVRFAITVLAEQWLLAHMELLRCAASVREVLAARRTDAIEGFVRDHLSFANGEVIQLFAGTSVRPNAERESSKAAA